MSDLKWLFLRRQFLANSTSAALGRAKVYRPTVTEGEAAILGAEMRSVLIDLAEQYSSRVTEEDHVRNIRLLADRVSTQCGQFLRNGRLPFGVAQKALNLFLKYLWCAGRIPTPPHCPFDRFIIGKLPSDVQFAWTRIEDEGPYLALVEAAKAKLVDESLAEWELRVYGDL